MVVARRSRLIEGVVRDASTGKPMASVDVFSHTITHLGMAFMDERHTLRAKTDAKGRFRGLVDVLAWSRPSPDSNAGRRLLGVFKRGKRQWESVPVPPELEKSMAGLAEAVAAVRELLEAGEIGKAGERMVGIEALVADMARRADPDRARGKKVLAGAILGKEMGGGRKAKVPTAELIAYYEANPKHTVGKTAQHFDMLYDTVKKRLQREKKK